MRRLKVVTSANALPSLGGGCWRGLASYFLKTLLWQGRGLLLISGAVNAIFLTQDPIPRHR